MYTLIGTAKLNGIDPQAWLAHLLRRIADHPASRLTSCGDVIFDTADHVRTRVIDAFGEPAGKLTL
jgi:hypothetical protein